MHSQYIDQMLRALSRALKDRDQGRRLLNRFWQDKIALVWTTREIHMAANENELVLTEQQAVQVLKRLHDQHDRQLGLRWEDVTEHLKEQVLGRPMTRRETNRFVRQNTLTIDP